MLPNLAAHLLNWLRAQFGSLQQPAPWLVGSLLLAVVATNLAWLAERRPGRLRPAQRMAGRRGPGGTSGGRTLADAPLLAPLFWLAGALFMLLSPLGAWQRGAISPYLLGLTEIDWVADLRNGALPAAAIVAISVLGWLVYRRTLRGPDGRLAGGPSSGALSGALSTAQRWTAPLDAALRQWHWAFYRAAAAAWLLAGVAGPGSASAAAAAPALRLPGGIVLSPPSLDGAAALYWGAWLGLAAVALEWLLDPFVRRALRTPGRQEAALRDAGLAIATTALFTLTRNFWLCLACQVLAETAMALWWGEERQTAAR